MEKTKLNYFQQFSVGGALEGYGTEAQMKLIIFLILFSRVKLNEQLSSAVF